MPPPSVLTWSMFDIWFRSSVPIQNMFETCFRYGVLTWSTVCTQFNASPTAWLLWKLSVISLQPKPRPLVMESLCRFLHTDALTCKHDNETVARKQSEVGCSHAVHIRPWEHYASPSPRASIPQALHCPSDPADCIPMDWIGGHSALLSSQPLSLIAGDQLHRWLSWIASELYIPVLLPSHCPRDRNDAAKSYKIAIILHSASSS